MRDIIFNEWRGFLRNNLFLIIIFVFTSTLLVTTYFGIIQNKKQIETQKNAKEHIREQWDTMDPTNPHRAAHFGSYAFKSPNVLNSLDEGINAVTGNVLRLEGHKQNDVMFSEVSQSLLISKFGKLKPSLLFQFILPLLLIFLSFNSYIKERESGRLKLLLVQGISLKKIVFSKMISIWFIGLILLFSTFLLQLIVNIDQLSLDTIIRLILLFSFYGIYYLVLINLTILFSLIFKNATASLSFTIIIWFIWTIFFPKIIGNMVEEISPLPTRVEFQKGMEIDRSKGIDGHNPTSIRKEALEKEVLAKYKVSDISDLPVNFTGILMQADEEYGNTVWDKHFGSLYEQLHSQKINYQLSGFINPFASIQSLSMGMAGTDMFHHLNFLKQAETYRRFLIKKLNDEYAFGGAKTGDRAWKADTEFFQSVKDFDYNTPLLKSFINKYFLDIISLFVWLLGLIFLLNYSSERIMIL